MRTVGQPLGGETRIAGAEVADKAGDDVRARMRQRLQERPRIAATEHRSRVGNPHPVGRMVLEPFEVVEVGSVVDHLGRVVDDRGIGSAVSTADRVALGLAAVLALLGVLVVAVVINVAAPAFAA